MSIFQKKGKIQPRSLVGGLILLGTVSVLGVQSYIHVSEHPREYTMQFVRGDRLADGSDLITTEITSFAAAHPDMKVKITGYTEPGSDEQANLLLSNARAKKVKEILEGYGIDSSHITTTGVGGTKPLSRLEGESENAWLRRSSRVDIVVGK